MKNRGVLERVDHRLNSGPNDTYIVASSFEPRSVHATSLIEPNGFGRAIVFSYHDTLDSVLGRANMREIRKLLVAANIPCEVLPCLFSDPYSAVRVFDRFLRDRRVTNLGTISLDITCFTKLHLLTLLQYLESRNIASSLNVIYTEPLSYGTAHGRPLSYGIEKAVYLPYRPVPQRASSRVGLVAFLGHERMRVERIVQELEPDVAVIVFGEPGFTRDIEDHSLRVNESLISRAEYDQHYRLVQMPVKDILQAALRLQTEVKRMVEDGCGSIYFAPLGTKIQALAIDLLRRSNIDARMVLAYSIPRRYERTLYSQGNGPTYRAWLYTEEDLLISA